MSLPNPVHCYPSPYPLLSWMLILLEPGPHMPCDPRLSVFKNEILQRLLGSLHQWQSLKTAQILPGVVRQWRNMKVF